MGGFWDKLKASAKAQLANTENHLHAMVNTGSGSPKPIGQHIDATAGVSVYKRGPARVTEGTPVFNKVEPISSNLLITRGSVERTPGSGDSPAKQALGAQAGVSQQNKPKLVIGEGGTTTTRPDGTKITTGMPFIQAAAGVEKAPTPVPTKPKVNAMAGATVRPLLSRTITSDKSPSGFREHPNMPASGAGRTPPPGEKRTAGTSGGSARNASEAAKKGWITRRRNGNGR